jgi:hypothetical protein
MKLEILIAHGMQRRIIKLCGNGKYVKWPTVLQKEIHNYISPGI